MDYKTLKEKYTEVIKRRTQTSKTFHKGNNSYTLVASRTPIHYTDEDGNFQEIDLNIVDGKIEKNVYKIELLTDCIGYSIVSRQDNSRIDVKLKKIGKKDISYSTPTIEGNKAHWYDIDTDVDFFIEFRGYRVRCWKVLKSDKASKDITFDVFEDDLEKKDLQVVEKIVGHDASGNQTIQAKDKGIEAKKKAEVSKKDIKSYELKQTFSDKVVVRDKKTRVKSESTEVTYPVMIDADVQVSIGNTADDGVDYYAKLPVTTYSALSTNRNGNVISSGSIFSTTSDSEAFTRFDGITIPQFTTIADATLNLYAGYYTAGPYGNSAQVKVYAFDENDPNAPTAPGDIRNKTTGIASNFLTTTFIYSIPSASTTATPESFDLYEVDVSAITQELVNSYDYNNEAMMFFYRAKNKFTNPGNFEGGLIYDYSFGSTQAPELVINFDTGSSNWPDSLSGVPNAGISKINGITLDNISNINGAS